MIDSIAGVVTYHERGLVAVNVAPGVSFSAQVPPAAHYEVGEELTLYTHLILAGAQGAEQTPKLMGFPTRRCREVFRLLKTVNGVGSVAALRILSLGSDEVLEAIRDREPVRLKVKGVGPKITKRIVDDLHKKVEAGAAA